MHIDMFRCKKLKITIFKRVLNKIDLVSYLLWISIYKYETPGRWPW